MLVKAPLFSMYLTEPPGSTLVAATMAPPSLGSVVRVTLGAAGFSRSRVKLYLTVAILPAESVASTKMLCFVLVPIWPICGMRFTLTLAPETVSCVVLPVVQVRLLSAL